MEGQGGDGRGTSWRKGDLYKREVKESNSQKREDTAGGRTKEGRRGRGLLYTRLRDPKRGGWGKANTWTVDWGGDGTLSRVGGVLTNGEVRMEVDILVQGLFVGICKGASVKSLVEEGRFSSRSGGGQGSKECDGEEVVEFSSSGRK